MLHHLCTPLMGKEVKDMVFSDINENENEEDKRYFAFNIKLIALNEIQ